MAATKLDPIILAAIKCGPVPVIRDITNLTNSELTTGEKVIRFAETFLVVPDGLKVGQKLRLEDFQKAFLLSVFDSPEHTSNAVFSVGRRNGKSFLMAVIVLASICGPLAIKNSTVASAAMSLDQAAILYRLAALMVRSSPELNKICRCIDSPKKIVGLTTGVTYRALSREAKSGLGHSYSTIVLDEAGAVATSDDDYLAMLRSSQGSYEFPRLFVISTQASGDAAYLSKLIDSAVVNQPSDTVVHLYTSPEEFETLDPLGMRMANPGLIGGIRSEKGLISELKKTLRLPDGRARDENLYLNRRTSQNNVFVAPSVWKELGGDIPESIWSDGRKVSAALDLSRKFDLTACVLACNLEDGRTAIKPYIFIPREGIEERGRRDSADYAAWADQGFIHLVDGSNMDYSTITRILDRELDLLGCRPQTIEFDRYGCSLFQQACEFNNVSWTDNAEWVPVGQHAKEFSPRANHFKGLIVEGKLVHPRNAAMNSAATSAISVEDAQGNLKVDKARSVTRVDALVAAIMAAYGVREEAVTTYTSYLDDPDCEGLMII